MLLLVLLALLLPCCLGQQYQKVAPGVPPQTYQQTNQQAYHPPQPQQHQVPVQPQFQQPPAGYQQQYQQQQVPQQQVPQHQQQVPHQQVHQAQHGAHGQHDPQLLNTANIAQEREHIQEHMEVPIDTSKMSEQELQFHYFKMHDADNNNKLDGCELIKSLIHWHEQGHKHAENQNQPPPGDKIFADNELVNLIDPILNMDDNNRDGYIDYPEFVRAQHKSQQREGAAGRD